MAFPSPSGGVGTNGTTASAAPVITLPTTVAAGDTLVVAIRVGTAGAIGWPGGWTEMWDVATDGSDDQFACAWKKADGSEGGTTITLSCTSAKFSAVAWRVTGAADPTVTAPEFATVATGASASPDPPSLTPAAGSKDYLFSVVGSWEGEQTSPPTSYPPNYNFAGLDTTAADSGTAAGAASNNRVAVGHRQLTTGAAENPGTFGISAADDWMVGLILYHPAAPTYGFPFSNASIRRIVPLI